MKSSFPVPSSSKPEEHFTTGHEWISLRKGVFGEVEIKDIPLKSSSHSQEPLPETLYLDDGKIEWCEKCGCLSFTDSRVVTTPTSILIQMTTTYRSVSFTPKGEHGKEISMPPMCVGKKV